ncbi:terminase large subunit [Pseudomonas sp. NFR16]|uniref:terminase large subunit n=1 Tax=Pseudomonas sp. NFR16 TaxID=1566248 RepID=UPI0008B0359A|nr:terminase large subunit [Pseudomonas sp. NFR16]SEJ49743.1 Phage terminase-like protein, large subunit, contains N-terminal HTH domain [Pseudomonas sp. NFR16]
MEWSTACPDWERRILSRQSLIPFPPLFRSEAEEALDLFKSLKVVDVPGQPTFGECCEQWVFDFVSAVFGAYDAETGQQKIREFFLLISKKNSKSTIAAGIMVTALVRNWRENEELLILAPTIEVAQNSFKPAAAMVRADPVLDEMMNVQDHLRTITHLNTKASLKVVAADSDTVSGKKSGKILIDELWVFGKRPNADAMLMEATGGLISRDEGFVIFLSTQSDEPPAGVFKEKLDYYRDVRDGKVKDKKSLGVLYEFPQSMIDSEEYLQPHNYYVTNPNMGRSVSAEWLEDQMIKESQKEPGSRQKFLAKHLNIQIGMNLRANRWPGTDFWERQGKAKKVTLRQLIKRAEVIDVGIDGGGLDDLLGLAAVGRDAITREWIAWTRAWAHPSVLDRRKSEAPRFHDFAKDGDLILVDRIGQDVDEVAELVLEIYESGLLDMIGVDPAGVGAILDALISLGIPKELVIGISQGWRLCGAIKTTERKLAEGGLVHGGQPLMAWCCGNAKVVPAGNAILITKQASGTAKIDPLMALFNAVELMSRNPVARGNVDDFFDDPIMAGL